MRTDPEYTANYIRDLSRQLAAMAEATRLDALAYILRMAEMEAENVASTSAELSNAA